MALANAQGHVSLNGQSYVLIEESYEKRAQQPFSARFATGDPSTGDLSFWQFLTQKGWTGEGQEKFDVVTKYRQSSGWDMRGGKAHLGHGIESVTLAAAVPTLRGSVTPVVYDDMTSGVVTDKWELSSMTDENDGYSGYKAPDIVTVASLPRMTTGQNHIGAGFGAVPAGRASGVYPYPRPAIHRDDAMARSGSWQFTAYTETSALAVSHVRFCFLGNSSVSYLIELSGSNMTTWKIIKRAYGGNQPERNDLDVVVGTFVATGGSATNVVVKVTYGGSGDFEVFEGGVSLGTCTDGSPLSITTPRYCAFTTYNAYSGAAPATRGASTWVTNVYLPGSSSNAMGGASKFVNYENGLYCCWYNSGADFAFTTMVTASQASNIPKMVHQNAKDIVVWSRDGEPTDSAGGATSKNRFLASVLGATFRCYSGTTQVFTGGLTIHGTSLLPINSTTIAIFGTVTEGDGYPAVEILVFGAGVFTAPTQRVMRLDGGVSGTSGGSSVLDSNGTAYFNTLDMTAYPGPLPSRIFAISAADLIATRPTITAVYTMSDFLVRGLFTLQGTVYLFGAKRRGSDSYASIIKLDGTVMWESTKAVDVSPSASVANFYNHGVPGVWNNINKVIFVGMNDHDSWAPVLEMDSAGNVIEAASFVSGQFSTTDYNILNVVEWNGRFYLLNAQSGTIKRTAITRGALGADNSYCTLELSKMGANTDLINKTLYSVTVELSAVVPSGETLSVLVNDTVVGTMVNADGVRKEIVLTAELTSAAFICKLRWPQASTWAGYISNGPLLKYVPTQFKKRAWGFGIRATKRLKLGDGTHESRTPTTMFSDIEAAWASNIPVTFIDVDGTSYSVLVTDFKQKRPLLQMTRSSEQEAFYFVELLQA